MKKKAQKPILVTGTHCSGTTWVGRMLAATSQVGYIQEPFNPAISFGENPFPFEHCFQYIASEASESETAGRYFETFSAITTFRYPFRQHTNQINSVIDLCRILKGQSRTLLYQSSKRRALLKDPIAFFSAEWLHQQFDMDVVVMIRHPAAFCASLVQREWQFDFSDFSSQPLLMEKYLYPFERDILAFSVQQPSILEQGILLWNIFYSVVQKYQKKHRNWIFIKHEDISRDPVTQFQKLYASLDLSFTAKAEKAILSHSHTLNTNERYSINRQQSSSQNLRRDSLTNIKTWKQRLSEEEILAVRSKTEAIASHFYSNTDWL